MTPDKPEVSVEELIKAVSRSVFRERGLEPEDGDAIRCILLSHAALKEEVRQLTEEKLKTIKMGLVSQELYREVRTRAEKAEAELAELRAKLQAVTDVLDEEWDGTLSATFRQRQLRAALAARRQA